MAICSTTILAITTPAKMNVILILADDVGFECIHACGSTYHTPNIDRMAERGMLFKHCHAQPLSTPSRVQLMTGKYNHRNYTQFAYLDPKEKTFAHLAKEAGYTTCIAGKWQLGYDSRLPEVFGFDSYCLWQLSQQRGKGILTSAPKQ
jgi:arylsulfatase A